MKNNLMKTYKCRFCGEAVTERYGNKYHTACIIDDLYDTYLNHKRPTSTQLSRARSRNIDVVEIKHEVQEDMRMMNK